MPDAENPSPPKQNSTDPATTQPTPLEPEEYATVADEYLESVLARAEELQEEREDVEVEYSVRRSPPTSRRNLTNQRPPVLILGRSNEYYLPP